MLKPKGNLKGLRAETRGGRSPRGWAGCPGWEAVPSELGRAQLPIQLHYFEGNLPGIKKSK